jgi:hypothetical protein
MNKQGSALIIALALMFFITTLGTIVLHTAHRFQALAIERSLQRPPHMLLESLTAYACQVQGTAWYKLCAETAGLQPHETYTTTLNGVVCLLRVGVEKGDVVVHASCPGKRGITHTLITQVPKSYQEPVEANSR